MIANENAIGQVVVVIQSPSISERRHKFLRDDIQPVLIEIIFLKRSSDELCDQRAILNTDPVDLRFEDLFKTQLRICSVVEF
jgi:hypothetical protein